MVSAITDVDITELVPNSGLKEVWIQTKDDVDATDTIAFVLTDYGIAATGLLAVQSWVQTANNSIITAEANTTAVVAGTLTITIAAGTNDDARVIRIVGRAIANVVS